MVNPLAACSNLFRARCLTMRGVGQPTAPAAPAELAQRLLAPPAPCHSSKSDGRSTTCPARHVSRHRWRGVTLPAGACHSVPLRLDPPAAVPPPPVSRALGSATIPPMPVPAWPPLWGLRRCAWTGMAPFLVDVGGSGSPKTPLRGFTMCPSFRRGLKRPRPRDRFRNSGNPACFGGVLRT